MDVCGICSAETGGGCWHDDAHSGMLPMRTETFRQRLVGYPDIASEACLLAGMVSRLIAPAVFKQLLVLSGRPCVAIGLAESPGRLLLTND